MPLSYYEKKVFTRAEGILKYCVLSSPKYEWSTDAEGSRVLTFYFKPKTPEPALMRAVEVMRQAFRKAKASLGETTFKLTDGGFVKIQSIAIAFEKKEAA